MYSEEQIQLYLQTANIKKLSEETSITRPVLNKMRDGDFNCHYSIVKKLSDHMRSIFGG